MNKRRRCPAGIQKQMAGKGLWLIGERYRQCFFTRQKALRTHTMEAILLSIPLSLAQTVG